MSFVLQDAAPVLHNEVVHDHSCLFRLDGDEGQESDDHMTQ